MSLQSLAMKGKKEQRNVMAQEKSLTHRRIGDLYWKKRKKMFASAAGLIEKGKTHGSIRAALKEEKYYAARAERIRKAALSEAFLKDGRPCFGNEDLPSVNGNEFKDRPPTASGDEVLEDAVAYALWVFGRYKEILENDRSKDRFPEELEQVTGLLGKTLDLWFEASGIDRETGDPVPPETKRSARAALPEAINAYEERARSLGRESDYGREALSEALKPWPDRASARKMDIKEDTEGITGSLISGFDQGEFQGLIPEDYLEQVRRGELIATAVFMEEAGEKSFLGLSVTGVHAGWLEIVYLYFPEENRTPQSIARAVLYELKTGYRRNGGSLCGAFMEMPVSEAYPELREGLALAGLEVWEETGNVYQFTLSEVGDRNVFLKASKNASFCLLKDADGALLNGLERLMDEDTQPVAITPVVEWEDYLPELSMILFEEERPTGLMLISEQSGYLVIELAYVASKTALPKLIGGVLSRADLLYGPDQAVLVPIVVKNSGEILERVVPEGRRNKALESMMWFDGPVWDGLLKGEENG